MTLIGQYLLLILRLFKPLDELTIFRRNHLPPEKQTEDLKKKHTHTLLDAAGVEVMVKHIHANLLEEVPKQIPHDKQ